MTGPRPSADELLELGVRAARDAARLVQSGAARGVTVAATKSSAVDVVTESDRSAERLIRKTLLGARPDDAVLGEEGDDESGTSGVRWIVDPIDGTVNFLYGIPQYAVSIAAELDGVVVAGVVRNAATGEEWTAIRGRGSWREGRRLVASGQTQLGQALVATGFGYDAARRAHQAAVLAQVLPLVRDVRRFGAASVDLCFAAEGRVDAYFEKGLNAWDHAAGGLVAAEAGLTVSGLRGAPPGPAMVLAAPPALHADLHDLLVRLDADGGP